MFKRLLVTLGALGVVGSLTFSALPAGAATPPSVVIKSTSAGIVFKPSTITVSSVLVCSEAPNKPYSFRLTDKVANPPKLKLLWNGASFGVDRYRLAFNVCRTTSGSFTIKGQPTATLTVTVEP
jgi:hypothetical protein